MFIIGIYSDIYSGSGFGIDFCIDFSIIFVFIYRRSVFALNPFHDCPGKFDAYIFVYHQRVASESVIYCLGVAFVLHKEVGEIFV